MLIAKEVENNYQFPTWLGKQEEGMIRKLIFPNPVNVFGFYYSIKQTLNIRIALYKNM